MSRRDPSCKSPPWCGECNRHRDDCVCDRNAEDENMKFLAIKPRIQKLEWIDAAELRTAEQAIGLGNVDHGMFWRKDDGNGLAYVVYEFGFYVPPTQQSYAAVFGKLIAGNAVVYAFNETGDTVSVLPEMISEGDVVWLPTQQSVEDAIAAGVVQRPIVAVDGQVKWSWPEPAPYDIKPRY
jgi:hypothetical protein